MKKLLIPSIFFVLLISFSFAQKPYKVVFYNLENFKISDNVCAVCRTCRISG